MKRTLVFCIAYLSLVGCAPTEDFMDALFGIKHNLVVLTPKAFVLSQKPISFTPATQAEVVGKLTNVCVVLAGGVPQKGSEQEGERLLNGAKVGATVITGGGATHEFGCQGVSWAMSGHIVPSNEIAACVHPSCAKQALSVGSKVRSVSISSTVPIHVLGAYWYSTAAFDRSGD